MGGERDERREMITSICQECAIFKGTFFEPISDLWPSLIASLDFWVSFLTLSGDMGILLSVPLALTPILPNRLQPVSGLHIYGYADLCLVEILADLWVPLFKARMTKPHLRMV